MWFDVGGLLLGGAFLFGSAGGIAGTTAASGQTCVGAADGRCPRVAVRKFLGHVAGFATGCAEMTGLPYTVVVGRFLGGGDFLFYLGEHIVGVYGVQEGRGLVA